jgi:NADH-quinone oxidoreductase subunit F
VGPADQHQQRQELGQRAADHREGADWFASIGTRDSKGTKIFSMVGKINNTGLVEVPMGISLRELIYEIGGGVPRRQGLQGGPDRRAVGRLHPGKHLDVPIDYQSLASLGAIMGSGGLVVCDEDTCMVDLARYFMSFTQEESCGKCVPCRVGTKAMLATLERICAGEGKPGDIEYLEELAHEVKASSLCGLGQTVPNPVLTTIRYFRDEYEAHIREQRCPAGVCTALVRAKCTNACPAEVDVPSYISLVAQGRYAEGLEVHRRATPLPWPAAASARHSARPSVAAASWTSPSPSARSSATWPTTSWNAPGRPRSWRSPRRRRWRSSAPGRPA